MDLIFWQFYLEIHEYPLSVTGTLFFTNHAYNFSVKCSYLGVSYSKFSIAEMDIKVAE